jgi:hypothetical protein
MGSPGWAIEFKDRPKHPKNKIRLSFCIFIFYNFIRLIGFLNAQKIFNNEYFSGTLNSSL